jgi:hypothetical protein
LDSERGKSSGQPLNVNGESGANVEQSIEKNHLREWRSGLKEPDEVSEIVHEQHLDESEKSSLTPPK